MFVMRKENNLRFFAQLAKGRKGRRRPVIIEMYQHIIDDKGHWAVGLDIPRQAPES
jgi:hypothetical protein